MAERIHQEWQQGKRLEPRPRILITGCPIGGAAEKVVRAIEETAAGSAMRTAPARKRPSAAVEEGDVYDALTDNISPSAACISPTTSVW